MGRGHDGFPAEESDCLLDAVIISCHVSVGNDSGHLFIDSLNYGLSTEDGQRFSWETGGCITGGDNGDVFHCACFCDVHQRD